jgi:hypothetical protein
MSFVSKQDNPNPPYQMLGKFVAATYLVQDFPLFACEFDITSWLRPWHFG